MQPLLKIQTIPIKIEAQTKRASLQYSAEPVPAPPRRPAPRPVPQQRPQAEPNPAPVDNRAQNRAAQRAAADLPLGYLQEASNAVQAYNNQNGVVDNVGAAEAVAVQPAPAEYQAASTVSPAPVQTAASTSFDYHMDRETFDWSVSEKPQLEYIPASIEYSISQYPDVVIEYVGEPIYVPASANPNYVPPPEKKG